MRAVTTSDTTRRPPLGVLLTGGMGTRLRPLTPDLPKSLVPLLNRPLVAYGLETLASMGLRDLVVVVGGVDPRTGPAAIEHAPAGTTVAIAVQPVPNGPGDALACVGDALDNRDVVVVAVDTILRGGNLPQQFAAFQASGAAAWLPLAITDRPKEMGIAVVEGERIVALEEKPEHPRSNLACVGVWMLAPEAVERVRTNPMINKKGESDLTGTIGLMLDEGAHLGGATFDGRWLDGGSLVGLLGAQSALLAELPPVAFTNGTISEADEASIERTALNGPVILGADVRITDCALGPEVVVGEGATLRGVRLQRALVAPGATVEGGEYADVVITTSGEIASAV